jgi:coenzyme F420-reducing hydrogenase delta subunit
MPVVRRRRRVATGRFATREELTCHVWAIQRQQVYPNVRAIALACGATMDVVKAIIVNEEGLDSYLEKGCLTGD